MTLLDVKMVASLASTCLLWGIQELAGSTQLGLQHAQPCLCRQAWWQQFHVIFLAMHVSAHTADLKQVSHKATHKAKAKTTDDTGACRVGSRHWT